MARHHISDELKEMALSMSLQGLHDSDIREYTGISERSLKRPGSAAPIAGANLLVTTRIVIQYYSNNMNIFPILSDPRTWNFLRTARGSHSATLLGKHTRLSVKSNK